jgi:hypothetical protein
MAELNLYVFEEATEDNRRLGPHYGAYDVVDSAMAYVCGKVAPPGSDRVTVPLNEAIHPTVPLAVALLKPTQDHQKVTLTSAVDATVLVYAYCTSTEEDVSVVNADFLAILSCLCESEYRTAIRLSGGAATTYTLSLAYLFGGGDETTTTSKFLVVLYKADDAWGHYVTAYPPPVVDAS